MIHSHGYRHGYRLQSWLQATVMATGYSHGYRLQSWLQAGHF